MPGARAYNPLTGISSSLRMWRYFAPRLLRVRDFSGGLNLRDAAPELAANESPDLWNVTLDERGGVSKRLGYQQYNATPFTGGLVQQIYQWNSGGRTITQAGASLYRDTTNTARVTFSDASRVGITEFAGLVWATHPVDGLYSSTDGVTWTAIGSSPKGSSLIAWQNRLLSVGDPASPTRVSASAIGDGTDFTTAAGHGWNNEIREKDASPVLCLAAATGIDIAGRPGLIACKRDSTYRLYDSSSGAYSTIDPNTGAASALSVTTLYGRTIILSRDGIYWTDGVSSLQKASARVDPLFHPASLNEAQLDLCAAGSFGDRCYFSMPVGGATANNLSLEYHPIEGWIVQGSNAMSCYTVDQAAQHFYGGSPSVSGRVYELLKTGADDGASIPSWFQSKWVEPNDGFFTRFLHVRVLGRGDFDVFTRADYKTSQGIERSVSLRGTGFTWNDPAAIWNSGIVWGPTVYEAYSPKLLSLGTGRAVSFRIQENSTKTLAAPALDGSGVTITTGAWGLGGVDLTHVQLGIA